MGRPHSAKSGRLMGQKDTRVETTYGKAQRVTATCRWTDDLVKIAKSCWMQVASDRSRWKSIGEAYGQQWTATG